MSESVFGYFHGEDEGRKAVEALRKAGFSTVQLDQIGRADGTKNTRNIYAGDISSLADLVMGTHTSDDEGVLLASHPAASGLAAFDGDRPRYLVVVVGDDPVKAKKILKAHGAS